MASQRVDEPVSLKLISIGRSLGPLLIQKVIVHDRTLVAGKAAPHDVRADRGMSVRHGGKIRLVTESLQPDLDARLHRVAVGFILPTGLRVDDAVMVAEDLVASGFYGEATVEVAALSRDSWGSDAEPLVRAMLSEHGIDVPVTEDEDSEYRVLLHAFGYWDLPIRFFEGPFYVRIPAWDDQGPLDRALVTMLDQRDHLTTPAEREAVEQEMRRVVRDHVPAK